MPKDIGNLIGKNIDASTNQASAVWKIQDQIRFKRSGSWPSLTNITSQYQISRSLMFNSPDSAYLSRTPGVAGNRKTWTWSGWVKRSGALSNTSLYPSLFGAKIGATRDVIRFGNDTTPDIIEVVFASGPGGAVRTQAVFRDVSAWYHIVISVDTTQATASNRARVYVNGSEITQFQSTVYPAQNYDTHFNYNTVHYVGADDLIPSSYFSGYLADIHFIDGQALTPSSFGEFDANGEWQPKAYTGTYGTNGFKLNFADTSAATAAALGKDTSGNGNNWTPNNVNITNPNSSIFASPEVINASGGTISNGGTPYWIDVLPTNAHLSYTGGSMGNVHDGNLSTYAYWVGDEYVIGNVMQARLDLSDFLPVSTVRIYSVGISGYVSYFARLLDASKNVIGGTTIDISPISLAWNSVPVAGSPRYLEIYTTSGIARRVYLHEIEVNGTILSNSGRGNTFVETPTSYGNGSPTFDTGVGGEVRGNYCTWNPLNIAGGSLENGNLDLTNTSGGRKVGTIGVSSGKWYWEVFITSVGDAMVGIMPPSNPVTGSANYVGGAANEYGYYSSNGQKYNSGSSTSYGATYTVGDVIGVALDLEIGTLTFYKNGISQGIAFSGLSGTFTPGASAGGASGASMKLNAGQHPFRSVAPSRFRALCDSNLSQPTIINPSTVMDTNLYTGNGSSITVSQLNFSPDLVWIKSRSGNTDHALYDTVRGATLDIASNLTTGQTTQSTGLTSFLSNGFSLGSLLKVNSTSSAYVSWCWDAGSGSAVLNQQGDTNSVVKANIGAGFSIATFTSPSSPGAYSVGHGLGVKPNFTIIKRINDGDSWFCWHIGLGDNLTEYLMLYTITGQTTQGGMWGTIGRTVNACGFASQISTFAASNYVMYNFAPVDGYSSFGKYTGNGSADGPFVFCNFRPKFLMIKRTDTLSSWRIFDSRRPGYNATNLTLIPNSSSNESTLNVDFLSNGFKLRDADTDTNALSGIYIYSAFAEFPFKYARAR